MRQVHQDTGKSLTGPQLHAEKLPSCVARRLFYFIRTSVTQNFSPILDSDDTRVRCNSQGLRYQCCVRSLDAMTGGFFPLWLR